MLLLCLDLARRSGIAYGDSNSLPRVETWDLGAGRDGPEHYAGVLGFKLRSFLRENPHPARFVVEQYMAPAAQRSQAAAVHQMMLHGALHAIGGIYRIPVTSVMVSTVRKAVCGRVTALPRGKGPATPRERAEARKATKEMVLARVKLLGYLPAGCNSDDQADACALFEWAKLNVAREVPGELRLFG